MTPQEQIKQIADNIVANLCSIKNYPDSWLPHTVWVEEESPSTGDPIYVHYMLEKINSDGTCCLYNPDTGILEYDDYHLSEINIDWLVTLWQRYTELCSTQIILPTPPPLPPVEKLYAFTWSSHYLERNVSDDELIKAWEQEPSRSKIDEEDEELYEVTRLTPDELAERINDDTFAYAEDYVRFLGMKE